MYIYLIIFGTSLLGILAMLVCRSLEIKKGLVPAPEENDAPLFSLAEFEPFYAPHVSFHRANIENSARYAASHCFKIGGICVRIFRDTVVHKHLKKVVDVVRGRQDVHSNGTASLFLQDIALHKQKVRKEKTG